MKHIFQNRFNTILCFLIVSLILATACQSGSSKTEAQVADSSVMKTDSTNVFDHMLVDNQKDPSCGMPVSAGIGDTAHYKDKVLGFCSKECKEAFEKNPDAMIAAAELKK